jgi:glycosyltransferase involved in cell wall biosynthesis
MSRRALTILHLDAGRGWRGGQRQVLFLVRHQTVEQRAALRVEAACPAGSPLAGRLAEAGLAPRDFVVRNALDGRAVRRLLELIERLDPAVVHCHDSHSHSIAYRAAGRLGADRPRILVTRRVALHPGRGPLTRLKYRSRRIDRLVGVSRYVTGVLRSLGVPDERLATVHSAAAAPRPGYRETGRGLLRGEFGVADKELVIGAVGAFTPKKGQRFLVRAAARICQRRDSIRFVLAGDGPRLEEARGLAAEHGLGERVLLPGWREDADALLAGCDVFCSPALIEGIGSTNLEALAHGLPVVASAVGGIPEAVVDGETGLLVPPGDVAALAGALLRLIDDPELRRRLGEGGRRRFTAEFSVPRMAERYLVLYRELTAE